MLCSERCSGRDRHANLRVRELAFSPTVNSEIEVRVAGVLATLTHLQTGVDGYEAAGIHDLARSV